MTRTDPLLSPRRRAVVRSLLAATILAAVIGIGLDMHHAWHHPSWTPVGAGYTHVFAQGWENCLNRLAYFTTQSNLVIALVSLVFLLRPGRTRLGGTLHLVALIGISLTGSIYVLVLARPNIGVPLPFDLVLGSVLEHLLVPLLAWAAYLAMGPCDLTPGRILLSAAPPLLYCFATFARGSLVDWYPYPFLDLPGLGVSKVFVNIVLLSGLIPVLALALGAASRIVLLTGHVPEEPSTAPSSATPPRRTRTRRPRRTHPTGAARPRQHVAGWASAPRDLP